MTKNLVFEYQEKYGGRESTGRFVSPTHKEGGGAGQRNLHLNTVIRIIFIENKQYETTKDCQTRVLYTLLEMF
jgi:hypothetical protein